jgi:hypothetical protein
MRTRPASPEASEAVAAAGGRPGAPARRGRRRSWSELTSRQRAGVVLVGLAEVVLTTAAARDLLHRGSGEVRGPRWAWGLALLVQPVGPLAYLVVGTRRRSTSRDVRG